MKKASKLIVAAALVGLAVLSACKSNDKAGDVLPNGRIFDSQGNVVVDHELVYDIHLDCMCVGETDEEWNALAFELAQGLSDCLGKKTAAEYYAMFIEGRENGERYLPICKDVDEEMCQKLEMLPLLSGQSICKEKSWKSVYPYGNLARRTLGYVTYLNECNVGIEGRYVDMISCRYSFDRNRILRNKKVFVVVPGKNLTLTIDLETQKIADSLLRASTRDYEGLKGACLVLMHNSGAIRAIVNLNRLEDTFGETYNHAVGRCYEPGSVIEPAIRLAFLGSGRIHAVDEEISLSRDDMSWLIESLEKFGIGPRYDDFDVTGMPDTHWDKTDVRWEEGKVDEILQGYGVMTSPIHLLAFYNALGNGGHLMKPCLVSKVWSQDGKETGNETRCPVELNESICNHEAVKLLAESLDMGDGLMGKVGTSYYIFPCNFDDMYVRNGEKQPQTTFAGSFKVGSETYSVLCATFSNPTKDYSYGADIPVNVVRALKSEMEAKAEN